MKHLRSLPFFALFALVAFSACWVAPTSEPETSSTQQALTAVSVDMWVVHMLAPPAPGFTGVFTMNEDATHPTPNLTHLQVSPNLALPQQYSFSTKQAIGQLNAADWSALSINLNNSHTTGSWVKVRLTYDSSVVADRKPWVPSTNVPPGFQTFLCAGVGLAFGPNCG